MHEILNIAICYYEEGGGPKKFPPPDRKPTKIADIWPFVQIFGSELDQLPASNQ